MTERRDLEYEIAKIKNKPESEWTAVDKAKVKALEDHNYWKQHDYDYEDDHNDY